MRGGTIPVPTIPRRGIVAGVVSLLVGALVLVGAAGPASAAGATCVYNTTTLEVEISVSGGGSVSIGRTSAGNFYVEGAADPTCPSPGGSVPTRLNVTKVKVTAGSDSAVTIDQTNGRFEPGVPSESGSVSEIEFEVTFAPSTLLGNLIEVIGTPADDVIRADGAGINLNDDNDNDVTGSAGGAFSNVDQIDFFGGDGNDLLTGVGNLGATPTDNSIKMVIDGQAGNDTIEGGVHASDVVSYDTSANPVDVDLGTNSGTGDGTDTIHFVEWVVGSDFDDVLKGDAADNRISPGSGDDRVLWSPGEDDLRGDGGTDVADFSGYTGGGVIKLHLDSPASAGNLAAKDGDTTIGGDPQRLRGSIENIIGTTFGDEIEGNDGANVLWGIDGGDTLVGRDGSDRLLPGLGDNLVKGDSGSNTSGTSDTVDYSDYAGDGTTGVTANLASGNVCKGTVTDNPSPGSCSGGNDFIFADVENLTGSPVDDVLTGSNGGNTITGLAGDDSLDGGSGDDRLVPGVGDDSVFGGGTLFGDTVDFSDAGSGVTVDLVAGTASSATDGNDTISVVDDVIGSPFADDILGNAGPNTIVAGVGDDTVEGGAGDDTLQGGDGIDTLTFENAGSGATASLASQSGTSQNTGHGSDTITGFENLTGSNHNDTLTGDGNVNVIRGLDGNDTIKGGAGDDLLEGGLGDDGLDGEGGTDTVTYANAPSGVDVDLSATSAQPTRGAGSDTIANVENLIGSAFADVLKGNASANELSGLAGNDTFLANSDADGNDIFNGGTGNDTVSYAARADGVTVTIDGSANDGTPATEDTAAETDNVETDIENVTGSAGNDTITGSSAANLLRGGAGNDTISGAGGGDTIRGDGGADDLRGGTGDDTVDGGAGNDALRGDSGNDTLRGGDGNDKLLEGSAKNGSDLLDGGAGTDEVDYSARTNPVKVTWDDLPNDGEDGEQDNVRLSIESVLTASGRIDPSTSTEPPPPPAPGSQQGYTLVGTDGGIFNFGTSEFHGSAPGLGIQLNSPIIGMAHTPGGGGYWQVAGDGGIFTFGDAKFHGSMGGADLNSPVLGMAATPSGNGYWLYAADGGIFSFGDAAFYGSMGDQALNKPVVSMTPTSDGKGYWLVASDGGIFSFGNATFHGSTGDITLNSPIFGLAADPDGAGYWMVARDGGVFAFDAPYHGAGTGAVTKAIGLAASPSVSGYWIADDRGHVLRFGGAVFLGDLRNIELNSPIVGFASVPPAAS